ncbi:MAG: hypothetical protein AB7S81_04815 [Bdellovibrionales bacterium]
MTMTPQQAVSILFDKTSPALTAHVNVTAAQKAFWDDIETKPHPQPVLTADLQQTLLDQEHRAVMGWCAALCGEMRGAHAETFPVLAAYMQKTNSSGWTMLAQAGDKPAVIAHSLCTYAAHVVKGRSSLPSSDRNGSLTEVVEDVLVPMLPTMIDRRYVESYASQILMPQQ